MDTAPLDDDAQERLARTWQWVTDFPVHPHPDLGRSGPVCPYMPQAVQRRVVELYPFDGRAGAAALTARARELREEFVRRCAAAPADRRYLVFFLVPYGLPDPELKTLVARAHAQLRPEFVRAGMLAGDFWPDHETRGLHSDAFRPFASPLPVLAMRTMILADLEFFAHRYVPAEEQRTYLAYYREAFGDSLPAYWQRRLAEAERAAHAAGAGGAADTGGASDQPRVTPAAPRP